MPGRAWTSIAAVPLVIATMAARADVVISTAATQDMSCLAGVCVPTDANATLNVADLENLLAAGNVKVTTTGSGVQAGNIVVKGAFGWSGGSVLALDAYQSIAFGKAVSIEGPGGLSLTTNDGGSGGMLTFGQHGRAAFQNLSSTLAINGASYTLVDTVQSLAAAVAANPAGNFAFSDNYNASADGTYADAPVTATLTGAVQGLGNTISDLSIHHYRSRTIYEIGLFAETGETAAIASVKLKNVSIWSQAKINENNAVGGIVGLSEGTLFDDHVSGVIVGKAASLGGLAGGESYGVVSLCSADVHISGSQFSWVGGLIGSLDGPLDQSYATGKIKGGVAGGLVGINYDMVTDSYSTATVSGPYTEAVVGGFFGYTEGNGNRSYSTGTLFGGRDSIVGGFVGIIDDGEVLYDDYWDTTTSGTGDGVGGGNKSGITGLTTQQLKSGLPSGFDPSIWAEDKKNNNGLPYLINNPPTKK